MRRMFLMSSALLATLALAGLAHSDDDLTVLHPGPNDIPAGRVLSTYLLEQAKTHFDARRAAIARLTTPALIDAYRSQLRSRFVASFGALPEERTPLNPRVVGRKARNAYSVERVIYESRPGFHVTANFYIPDGTGPFPGVLVPCGHSDNGKAAETYQRIAILLARNGMAALCYDPIGQGERLQLLDASGKAAIKGSTTEHTMIGAGALLVGRTAAGYRLWDGLRSLDYLASRPEVDPGRLGCTGNSGGGTMTAYLMAFDDRIQAAAPSCYITSLERLFATIGPQDAEQNLYGQVASGIEHADFITLRAPRPTLLSVGTKDFFDIDGSWTTFREVKEIYGTLGYGERIDLFESNEPHGFTRPRRVSCMRFLRRWLLDRNDAPTEPDFPIAPDRELQCTETGQVLSSLKGRSAFQLTAERAEELDRARAPRASHREPGELQALVKKTLDLPGSQSILVENHRSIERPGYRIDLWTLATEPGAVVIERLFRPENAADGKPMVVYLGADRALAAPGGEIEKRVLAGEIVAMIEPRGTGETTPSGKTSRKGPFGPDESEAFLSFHLARPLLAQRAYDVIQAFRAMQKPDDPEARGFHLVGVGAMAPVALHVAAIDSRVKELTLVRPLISWSALARTPVHRDQLANVLYGVLASYDLPEVAASLAPRPLTLRGVVDPAGKAADPTEVAQVYAACLAAYKTAGAAEHLRITNEP
ncbi:MAG: acetylxylan esterase [Isosphaeraceae bacterium]